MPKKLTKQQLDKRVMEVFKAVFQETGKADEAERAAKAFRAREEKRK